MSMQGIDISGWQPANICRAVPHDFAIVKATQGSGFVSNTFEQQINDALATGKAGVYHFDNGDTNWQAECDHFLNVIRNYTGRVMVVWDWEASAINRGTARLKNILSYLKAKLGFAPVLYASGSVITSKGLQAVCKELDCGIWCANYPLGYQTMGYRSDLTPYTGCMMHQYTSSGRLAGYSGNLDLNQFYGNGNTWDKYCTGNGKAESGDNAGTVAKTNDQLATEVIAGQWGNDADRRRRLEGAGYDYNAVQAIVNARLGANSQTMRDYQIKSGDTLSEIAMAYGTTVSAIQNANGIANPNLIQAGAWIKIPVNGGGQVTSNTNDVYTIKQGDNLSTIAVKFGTTVAKLQQLNGISNPDLIYAGTTIRIR